jgi:hypothetical protein
VHGVIFYASEASGDQKNNQEINSEKLARAARQTRQVEH